jgi:hypothetical protein
MIRKFSFVLLVLAAFALTIDHNASAYTQFSGSNSCDQCHTTFDGFGESSHDFHNTFASCADCHGSSGDNPPVANCATCHDSNTLWNYHLGNAPADGNGLTCSSCHTVPNEEWSWSKAKKWFK